MRKLRLGMLWHSPNSGNLGVGALTLGNMALARRAAAKAGCAVEFELLGFADNVEDYVTGPDVRVTPLDARAFVPFGALARALEGCDLVLDIGAGDSFTDIYGAKRFAYLWLSKVAAKLHGKPLVMSPQTIGPFDKAWARLMGGYVMERADRVFARDPQSLTIGRAMAPGADIALATDVAFALPYETLDLGPGIHVGINVSGLLFSGGYTGANEFGMEVDYPAFTRALIAAFQAREGVTVHLVPHVCSDFLPRDDDGAAIRTLAGEFPGTVAVPAFADPVAAKSYIAGLDFLVGGRMHACIAAFSSGVAVVPVAYSRKFSGLFEGLLDYHHLVPVTGMGTAQATDFVLSEFETRAELAADTRRSQAKVDGLLGGYVDALAELFAATAQRSPAA